MFLKWVIIFFIKVMIFVIPQEKTDIGFDFKGINILIIMKFQNSRGTIILIVEIDFRSVKK